MSDDQKSAEIIRDLAAIKEITIEGVPCVLRPNHFELDQFPELLPAPKRTKQNVIAHDVAGFIAYICKFKTEATALFAALEPKPMLKGIVDYHAPGAPSHCEHSVSCGMEHAEEWKRWTSNNNKKMDQKAFGLFL